MSAYDKYSAPGDGDLTPEQLDGMEMWDRDVMLAERHRAVGSMLVRMAVAEIRRHRAAQTASTERVRAVVRAAAADVLFQAGAGGVHDVSGRALLAGTIADRVAAQLTASPIPPAPAVGHELPGYVTRWRHDLDCGEYADALRNVGAERDEARDRVAEMETGLRAWRADVVAAGLDDEWILTERIDALLARAAEHPDRSSPLAPGDSVVLEVDGQIAGMRTAVDPK